ncbi:uncharacterized protein LOC121280770 isoform X3 [Carcharodon carcharias]|uniref:uncharacterized protein LOC121280770 isoform X3 n=1 Tax=Carcharodon carcharias TaxID=13397 RepID=UPI001B7E33BE|nr:uncharacterized protein LOC121280770 isoform X3 [Carcharodon carcharias]
MEGLICAASDQIQEAELTSPLDRPKQEQTRGNRAIDVNLGDVATEAVHQESSVAEGRSRRICRKRSFSPEVETVFRTKAKRKINPPKSKSGKRAGVEFCCDICKSASITNPHRRGNRLKESGYNPSPRWKNDPKTGQVLTLCNACGLAFGRPRLPHSPCTGVDADERRKHQDALQAFASFLTELLGDQDAEKLCCPLFVKKPCQCLQNYIKRTGDELSECRHRAVKLLQLLKEARRLSLLKCYDENQVQQLDKSRKGGIGLGNGQRKSKAFEEFVLKNRTTLKNELKLCERATQRILGYSNNFLHKKLKTDPEKGERVKRTKGKGALGLLKPITELLKERCCVDNCVSMAHTHGRLLHLWRECASKGQAEARRALAEMLTPSGGSHSNCYRFISWVTGCSHSTISRVSEQMRRTGGDREPPPHGLKKWWKEKTKTQGVTVSKHKSTGMNTAKLLNAASSAVSAGATFREAIAVSVSNSSLSAELSSLPATVQLQVQQQQIEALKKQVQVLQEQQQQHSYKQLQVVVQTMDLPSGVTLQNVGNLRPQSQAALLHSVPSQPISGYSNEQCAAPPNLRNVTVQDSTSQPVSQGPLAVQRQSCQLQQRKQPQQIGSLQQVESGTLEGLVTSCNQLEAQQEAMAHLQHLPVQVDSLTQCRSREEQPWKQPAPSNFQQAPQVTTVTGDCQTRTNSASAQTGCITTGCPGSGILRCCTI